MKSPNNASENPAPLQIAFDGADDGLYAVGDGASRSVIPITTPRFQWADFHERTNFETSAPGTEMSVRTGQNNRPGQRNRPAAHCQLRRKIPTHILGRHCDGGLHSSVMAALFSRSS